MTPHTFRILSLAISLAAAALGGCGSSDSTPSGSTGALTSCNSYCDAYLAAACTDPLYTSVADCKTSNCGALAAAPSGCQGAIAAYYDCLKALPHTQMCSESGCSSQFAAFAACQ